MFRNLFANIPDVTKNLLIINVLFFLATLVFENQEIYLQHELGMHIPNSNFFKPYQVITHFFMHADFMHLLFNMIGLLVFGSQLERVWGKRRFFIFYVVTALGAAVLHTGVQIIEVHQMTGHWLPELYFDTFAGKFEVLNITEAEFSSNFTNWLKTAKMYSGPSLGASGAVYGLLMAFALLFPNTQFMLLFPPIPIKAKYLALILGGIAVYMGFKQADGDSIAHFAHLGGMLFGFIMIQIWKRNNSNFY